MNPSDLSDADLRVLVHALAVNRLAELRREHALAKVQKFDAHTADERHDEIVQLASVLER